MLNKFFSGRGAKGEFAMGFLSAAQNGLIFKYYFKLIDSLHFIFILF